MSPTSDPTDRSMFRDTMTRTIPVAMIAMPDGLDGHRDHVGRLDQLAAAQDVERQQDEREGHEHAEQAEIDLRLGEHAPDRGSGWRLDLIGYRCRVGHVRHDGPPGPG